MVEGAQEISKLIQERYVPTSIERRRAALMYFLVGIIMSLEVKKISYYERYHLKQSLGWWTLFFMIFVLSVFLFFIPYIRLIPIFIFVAMFIVWAMFIKQAWDGQYLGGKDQNKILLPFFSGFGGWIISIFEIDDEEFGPEKIEEETKE